MKIIGKYRFSNHHWIANIKDLDIIQIGKTKEELCKNLQNEINILIGYANLKDLFVLNFNENEIFTLKFFEQTAFSCFIFKALRRKAKLSQSKVASKLNIVRTSYSQYEEAKKEPTLSKFNEILEAMGFECEIFIKKRTV